MKTLNLFGRRCIAWPCAIAGAALTGIAHELPRFAAWIMDFDDIDFDDDAETE
jgi:hypothetical protein